MAQTEPTPVSGDGPPPAIALDFLSPAQEIEQRPLPRLARITLYALLLGLTTGTVWSAWAEIDKVVIARGRLVTTTATIVAQPLETAMIRSIDVRPGDLVKKGQVLATFDATFTQADVGQLETKRLSLEAQIGRLETELAGRDKFVSTVDRADAISGAELMAAVRLQVQLFNERRDYVAARGRQYDESLARLDAKLASNRQEQVSLRGRIRTVKQIVDMHQTLVQQNAGSRLKLLEVQDQMQEVERQLAATASAEAELTQEQAVVGAERASFLMDWRQKAAEELVAARREGDAVMEQLSKASRRNDLVTLTASADAVVLEIAKRSVGSIAQAAEPLVTMVPAEAPLEAEVQIEAPDIGLLRNGDPARLKLEAFPFQRHGTLPAKLRTISEDAFARKEGDKSGTGQAYYVARLEIGSNDLRSVPPDTRLLPGLTLSSEIVVGRRTVLSYFLYPLMKAFDESIREP